MTPEHSIHLKNTCNVLQIENYHRYLQQLRVVWTGTEWNCRARPPSPLIPPHRPFFPQSDGWLAWSENCASWNRGSWQAIASHRWSGEDCICVQMNIKCDRNSYHKWLYWQTQATQTVKIKTCLCLHIQEVRRRLRWQFDSAHRGYHLQISPCTTLLADISPWRFEHAPPLWFRSSSSVRLAWPSFSPHGYAWHF